MAIRLKHLSDARRFLARIANEVYNGTLERDKGATLAHIMGQLIKAIHLEQFESRLETLEEVIERQEKDVRSMELN